MNSSIISVYDNVSTPSDLPKRGIYSALNDLFNINTDLEVRIFCPLCENTFSFKFSLFEHLRTFHYNFLTQMSNQSLKFKECPFCNAKFYGKHLTAKHVLHHHHKVIRGLFVSKNKFKCFFCNEKLFKENCSSIVMHIEELHFLDFVEEFRKMFANDTNEEVFKSDTVLFTLGHDSQAVAGEDASMSVQKHLDNTMNSNTKNFDVASRTNCYDFTDLKQQLENLKNVHSKANSNLISSNRSILKDVRNLSTNQKSVRRVLRFDLPSNDEDKENSFYNHTFYHFKPISIDEYNLLCNENKSDKFFKYTSTICGEPQYYSTPKSKLVTAIKNERKKDNSYCRKANMKSEKILKQSKNKLRSHEKKASAFGFQCGKCRVLFEKNSELVCHVKNNHKFSLNALQPCYHCAICSAKFYKNHYLKKHHNLH